MTVDYLLTDHASTMLSTSLGSASITTDSTGAKVSEMRYAPCPLRFTSGALRICSLRYFSTSYR